MMQVAVVEVLAEALGVAVLVAALAAVLAAALDAALDAAQVVEALEALEVAAQVEKEAPAAAICVDKWEKVEARLDLHRQKELDDIKGLLRLKVRPHEVLAKAGVKKEEL